MEKRKADDTETTVVESKRKKCDHGKRKSDCAICSNCGHNKIKAKCAICNNCGHDRVKYDCTICNNCGHGKLKRHCTICKQTEPKTPNTVIDDSSTNSF